MAPGYCKYFDRGCLDGCGIYPDRVKAIRLHRVGNTLQMEAEIQAYPHKPCDPSQCTAQWGSMRVYGWIDWNGDRAWDDYERVYRFIGYPHLASGCQGTFKLTGEIPIPPGTSIVPDTTWMRLQVRIDQDPEEWIDPCIWSPAHCLLDGSGAAIALDKRVRLDQPAVTRVQVIGTHTPIKAVSDTVFMATLTPPGVVGPNTGSGIFAAGFADGGPKLHVTLGSAAGDTSYIPKIVCDYEMSLPGGQTFAARDTFSGWRGTFPVRLPHRIGSYPSHFRFSIVDDEGDTLRLRQDAALTAYVTYQKAVAGIPPEWIAGSKGAKTNTDRPRLIWLQRATEWAAGDTVPIPIARTLLANEYAYGAGGRWDYKDATTDNNQFWWLMKDVGGTRGYGDCFAVSQMWKSMMSVLGIREADVRPYDGWFLSKADHNVSFDGVRTGNAGAWVGGNPLQAGTFNRWFFVSHQVGRLGGTYFDPTLNHEFTNFPNDFIQSPAAKYGTYLAHPAWQLADTHLVVRVNDKAPWGTNSYQPYGPTPQEAPALLASEAIRPGSGATAELQGPYVWEAEDGDGDGRAETLRLDGFVRVTGTVSDSTCVIVDGSLFAATTSIATASADRSSPMPPAICVTDTGAIAFQLRFDGDQVLRSGSNGPYDAVVHLIEDGLVSPDSAVVASPALVATDFGSDPIRILGVTDVPIDTDGGDYINYIAADVTLAALTPTHAELEAQLAIPSLGQTFQQGRASVDLPAGDTVVRVLLDASELAPFGVDGPYDLHVALVGGRGPRAVLDTVTAAYPAAMLDVPSAYVYVNEVSAILEDTDGSGLADWLRFNLAVEALEGDTYTIECELATEDTLVPVLDTRKLTVVLPELSQSSIPIRFDGRKIRGSGVDGPYWIRTTRIFRSSGALASERHDNFSYQAVAHTAFDTAAVSQVHLDGPCSFTTPDGDANGALDALRFVVPLIADSTGVVRVSGWISGAHGPFALAETTITATAGVPTSATLAFDGREIYGHGDTGPFVLDRFLAYPERNFQGLPSDGVSATSLCATGVSAASFEPAALVIGLVRTAAGPLPGAGVVVDSMPPAEDFATTDEQGNYRAFRRTPGSGTSIVRLQSHPEIPDSSWRILVGGAEVARGRRVEVALTNADVTRVDFVEGAAVGVDGPGTVPLRLRLLPISPNPARRGLAIPLAFDAPSAGVWAVRIVNVAGRVVGSWNVTTEGPGRAGTTWDTRSIRLARGVYFVHVGPLGSSGQTVQKVVVLE